LIETGAFEVPRPFLIELELQEDEVASDLDVERYRRMFDDDSSDDEGAISV
jgi:hypothetical protein